MTTVYLEVQVAGEILLPRTQMLSAPYALNADALDGRDSTYFAPASGSSSYVQLQGATPGTQQTGHMNISGTGVFGGNLGIGTNAPGDLLETRTNTNGSYKGAILVNLSDQSNSGAQLKLQGPWNGGYLRLNSGSATQTWGSACDLILMNTNVPNYGDILFGTNTLVRMTIDVDGNVGVGDTSPAALFTVGNGDKFRVDSSGNLVRINDVPYSWPGANGSGVLTNNGSGTLTWDATGGMPSGTEGQMIYNNGGTWTAFSGCYWDDTNSRLGVGTTGPTQTLDVNGSGRFASDLYVMGSDIYTNDYFVARSQKHVYLVLDYDNNSAGEEFRIVKHESGDPTDPNTLFLVNSGGNVGIGTTGPAAPLHIAGDSSRISMLETAANGGVTAGSVFDFRRAQGTMAAPGDAPISAGGTYGALGDLGAIQWDGYKDGAYRTGAAIVGRTANTGASIVRGEIAFWTATNVAGGMAERMRINLDGNVGVGDTSPAALFTVGSGDLFQVSSSGVVTSLAASNQLVLSSAANQLTLNSGTSAAARTYTVPDVGGTGTFAMLQGAQTFTGQKTFSAGGTNDTLTMWPQTAGANSFLGTLRNADLTGPQIWNLPNASGTIALTSDIPTVPSFAIPNLTLGTANAAGSATTVIRSDATILAFDATNPAALGTAGPGTATVAARRDHVHPALNLGTGGGSTFSGTLPVSYGGTGQSSLTAGRVVVGNGTSAVSLLGPTAANQVLRATGADTPVWGSIVSGDLPSTVMYTDTDQTVTGLKTFNTTTGNVPFAVNAADNSVVTNLNSDMVDGVNISSPTQWGVMYAASATSLGSTGAGTAGQALIAGATAAPSWWNPNAGGVVYTGTGGVLAEDFGNFFWHSTNKQLGIGTPSPQASLHIQRPATASGDERRNMIVYDSTAWAAGVGGGISFGGMYNAGSGMWCFTNIKGIKENATIDDYASAMVFSTRANLGSPTERMRISSGGNLGLGTNNPLSRLHVSPATAAALQIDPYGVGVGNTGEFRLLELAAGGTDYVGLKAPDAVPPGGIVWTLPDTAGSSGQVLTRGAGNSLSWSSASGSIVMPILFTRGTVGGTTTAPSDADKDTLVQGAGELGGSWKAATLMDIALYFKYNQLPANAYFYVAGSTSVWSVTSPLSPGNPLVLTAQPPPPPGGNWTAAPVAAIHTSAPMRFTRGAVGGSTSVPTTAQKDTLVTTEFGSDFRAATILDAGRAFNYCLPPNNVKFYVAAHDSCWGITDPSSAGNPLIITADPPPPPGGNWPQMPVLGVRR
ncbi:MAG: hypothetical protein RDV41_07610 [Planctomycetota bacterium]|nr:hypothetical protein [Planctomycetota bacterium]